ncbi:hypothetical protein MRY87_12610 [bacterium]|nr:hypothetical protein [bacterium]
MLEEKKPNRERQPDGVSGEDLRLPSSPSGPTAEQYAAFVEGIGEQYAQRKMHSLLVAQWIDGDLRVHDEAGEESRQNENDQPQLTVPPRFTLVQLGLEEVIHANQVRWFKPSPATSASPFAPHALPGLMPRDLLLKAGRSGRTGLRSQAQLSHVGPIPFRLSEACFMALTNQSWRNGNDTRFIHPTKLTQQAHTVPLIGEIYHKGKPLSEDQLAELGIFGDGYSDSHGDPQLFTAPVFADGGRSILLPGKFPFFLKPNKAGGYTLAGLSDFNTQAAFHTAVESGEIEQRDVVALQYKGIGTERYLYHVAPKESNGRVVLAEDDFILSGEDIPQSDKRAFVQRSGYAGKQGIFLDLQHQPGGSDPTGGLSSGIVDQERDAKLLAHGAYLGGFTFDSIVLFTRAELERVLGEPSAMVSEQVEVSVRALFEDTHRLDVLTKQESNGKSPNFAVRQLLMRDYGAEGAEQVEQYLSRLAGNMGLNTRVCLGCGYTVPKYQRTRDGFHIYGGILDSENFTEMKHRFQSLILVDRWLSDLLAVAAAAGVPRADFLKSPSFERYTKEFLGEDGEPVLELIREISQEQKDLGREAISLLLARAWVSREMIAAELTYSGEDLTNFWRKSDEMQQLGRLSEDEVVQLGNGAPLSSTDYDLFQKLAGLYIDLMMTRAYESEGEFLVEEMAPLREYSSSGAS